MAVITWMCVQINYDYSVSVLEIEFNKSDLTQFQPIYDETYEMISLGVHFPPFFPPEFILGSFLCSDSVLNSNCETVQVDHYTEIASHNFSEHRWSAIGNANFNIIHLYANSVTYLMGKIVIFW